MTSERDEISGTGFNLGQPAPGVIVGNGRYRLVAYHGDRPQLQFWQGIDLASGQEVALTLVDADGAFTREAPGFEGKRVLKDNGDKGDAIHVVVTASDGSTDSAPKSSEPVIVQNSAPNRSG